MQTVIQEFCCVGRLLYVLQGTAEEQQYYVPTGAVFPAGKQKTLKVMLLSSEPTAMY